MLWLSASRDASEPLDDGRELLRPDKRDLRPPDVNESLVWDLAAVRGEKPLGGLAVRITGALAASSSSGVLSLTASVSAGFANAP